MKPRSVTSITKSFVAAISLLILSGCEPEIEVTLLSGASSAPQFRLAPAEAPDAEPHFNTVMLLDESRDVLWRIYAEVPGPRNGVRTLTYGETPPGFKVVVPPKKLAPGARYALVAIGKGYGQLTFVTDERTR